MDTFLLFMPHTVKYEAEIVMSKLQKLDFNFSYAVSDEGETLAESLKIASEKLK